MNRHDRSDRGIALPAVLGLGVVMTLLVGTALGVVVSGLKQASSDQDFTAALDAAYAGVGDYMARLNLNPLYVQDGNPDDHAFGDSGTRTMDATNKAFGITVGGTWATVPGSNPAHPAQYRYEVDNSQYQSTGTVRLRATGMVGTAVRTIVASIRVSSFFDYVYFTNYETQDPTLSGHPKTCAAYAWSGRATSCGTLQFGSHDVIYGQLRSNDTITSCNATFNGLVMSASTANPLVQTASGCASSGTFAAGQQRTAILTMPDTNAAMQSEAATGGCLYTGPTTITYNTDGTMTVVSPWTKYTRVDGGSYSNPAMCGSLDALHSTGATVPQLDQNLLYVQDVPSPALDPANGWPSGSTPSWTVGGSTYALSCLGADGSTPITGSTGSSGWSFGALRHPLAGEAPATGWTATNNSALWNASTPAYGCTSGDLYVQGQDQAQTTAGSSNYVYVTGDLTVKNTAKDVLGIVGQNGVIVYNPMKDTGTTDVYGDEVYAPMLSDGGRTIDAAIMCVAHTFQVQNYDKGTPRGTLSLLGSIAQQFRGPVGTGTATAVVTGYAKAYQYDPLLKTVGPPDFLAPSSTTFAVSQYASVPMAFGTDGSLK